LSDVGQHSFFRMDFIFTASFPSINHTLDCYQISSQIKKAREHILGPLLSGQSVGCSQFWLPYLENKCISSVNCYQPQEQTLFRDNSYMMATSEI
jgi:hypothetical protein